MKFVDPELLGKVVTVKTREVVELVGVLTHVDPEEHDMITLADLKAVVIRLNQQGQEEMLLPPYNATSAEGSVTMRTDCLLSVSETDTVIVDVYRQQCMQEREARLQHQQRMQREQGIDVDVEEGDK